ncbi:hypothetical protein LCGC14_2395150, partial [marine sediment metagenome]
DNYFDIADHDDLDFANGEDFTLMVMGRTYNVTEGSLIMVAKNSTFTEGVAIGYSVGPRSTGHFLGLIADGTQRPLIDGPAVLVNGEAFVGSLVRNTGDDDLTVFKDGTAGTPATDTTTSTLANALAMNIGRFSGMASYFNGEIHAVVLWREALTDDEVALAGDELLGVGQLLLLGVG